MSESVKKIRFYGVDDIDSLPYLQCFSDSERLAMKAVAHVLPFRSNNYIVENLIDWHAVPDDPLFRLTFVHPDMLPPDNLQQMMHLLESGASKSVIQEQAHAIRQTLNPHPSGQKAHNIPSFNHQPVPGVQHKYRDTLLIFPTAGQSCHAYCSFCFRWPQFVGVQDWKFATRERGLFWDYLSHHHEITDVLLTGGDPMTMKASILALYLQPLLEPEFDHVTTIRIGTKSLSYWPYRYLTDPDTDDLLRLLEQVVASGKHLTFMAHYNHGRELEPAVAQAAIQRVRYTGAQIRTQSPLVRYINDSAEIWAHMWQLQVRLGCIPYYMFVERQTGAKHYFEMPLVRSLAIYREAIQQVSGLAQTARGPVMSALPGKVAVEGIAQIGDEKVFALSFLRAREPSWCKQPFYAKYSDTATWLTDLLPAFNQETFFYESELHQMLLNPTTTGATLRTQTSQVGFLSS